MNAEQFAWAYIKSEFLYPKRLLFQKMCIRDRDKYLAMGRYSDGIDSVILKVMKPNTSRRFFW